MGGDSLATTPIVKVTPLVSWAAAVAALTVVVLAVARLLDRARRPRARAAHTRFEDEANDVATGTETQTARPSRGRFASRKVPRPPSGKIMLRRAEPEATELQRLGVGSA